MKENIKAEIDRLREEINYHNKRYYIDNDPVIDDRDFDMMLRRLERLEQENPEYITPDSPTQRVGGSAEDTFEKVTHNTAMLSLEDAFSTVSYTHLDVYKRQGYALLPGLHARHSPPPCG